MECLKQFLKAPASHLNELNKIAPALIENSDFASSQKLVESLLSHEILTALDMKYVLGGEKPTDKVLAFVTARVSAVVDALLSNVSSETELETAVQFLVAISSEQDCSLCLEKLAKACFAKVGSTLQVAFVEKYALVYADVLHPALQGIDQTLKPQKMRDLLLQFNSVGQLDFEVKFSGD